MVSLLYCLSSSALKLTSDEFEELRNKHLILAPPISLVMATEGRVKLYCFNESLKWNDLGTGRINLMYLERLQGLAIIIRSEADGG